MNYKEFLEINIRELKKRRQACYSLRYEIVKASLASGSDSPWIRVMQEDNDKTIEEINIEITRLRTELRKL